jgi:phage terminase small subunit
MAKRSGVRGNKQLKPRQVAFVKNLVDGMTITEAARKAGYSRKCPGQAGYQALQNLKLKMPELLDRLGLSATCQRQDLTRESEKLPKRPAILSCDG